ncbi:MAG: hypothetical protein KDB36_16850 [Acidimicrobiales bacterium]|nr:hypothetical protein [Acidimicrobiales bacterium]
MTAAAATLADAHRLLSPQPAVIEPVDRPDRQHLATDGNNAAATGVLMGMLVMEHTHPTVAEHDELLATASVLRSRADGLSRIAADVPALAAVAVRRRAQELELAAWVAEVQAGVPEDQIRFAA